MRRQLVIPSLASALLLLSGCGSMLGSMLGAGQNTASQDNYFSYVAPAAPQPGSSTGLVVGSVSLEGRGSVFHVRRVSDGAIVPVKLQVVRKQWRKLGFVKLAILPKKRTVETREVRTIYAGSIPRPNSTERRRDLPRELTGGSVAASVLLGDSDNMERSIAFSRQNPVGWFVIALPPGEYQLVNLEAHVSEPKTVNGQRVVETRNYSVATGPRFTVTAGRSNYLGSWNYSSDAGTRTADERTANALLATELGRLSQRPEQWPLVAVGN